MSERRNDRSIVVFLVFLIDDCVRYRSTIQNIHQQLTINSYLIIVKSHASNGLKSSMESKLEGVRIHRLPRLGCRSRDSVPRY